MSAIIKTQPYQIFLPKHLYVHIPFCEKICTYCDFQRVLKTGQEVDRYVALLLEKIQLYADMQFDSIYLGGGTPNCLTDNQLDLLLAALAKKASPKCEFSVECNPELVTLTNVQVMRNNGVNRISLGVQTLNETLLRQINRVHQVEDIERAITILQHHGLQNISCDFIYGLAGQNLADLETTLLFLQKHNLTHASFYSLEIKPNSIMAKQKVKIDDALIADQLAYLVQSLPEIGFCRYEVANWVLAQQFRSQHNLAYWLSQEWLGLGYGAWGFYNRSLIHTTDNIYAWNQKITCLSTKAYYQQVLFMGLRLVDGLDLNLARNQAAYNFFQAQLNHTKIKLDGNRIYVVDLNNLHDVLLDLI